MGDYAERLADMRLGCIPVFLMPPSSPDLTPSSPQYDSSWPTYGMGGASMRGFETYKKWIATNNDCEEWAMWLDCADHLREQIFAHVEIRIFFSSKQELIANAFNAKSTLLVSGFDLATYFHRELCEKLQRLSLDAQAVAYAMPETVDRRYSRFLIDDRYRRVSVFS